MKYETLFALIVQQQHEQKEKTYLPKLIIVFVSSW